MYSSIKILAISIFLFSYQIAICQLEDHHVYIMANLCDSHNLMAIENSISNQIKQSNTPATVIINGDITSSPISTSIGRGQVDRFLKC